MRVRSNLRPADDSILSVCGIKIIFVNNTAGVFFL